MELTEDKQKDYDLTRKKIEERIMPADFVTLDEFHKRRLHPGESSLFVYHLKKLLDQAMPGMDATARKQLLLHQFLCGLPVSVSKQIRAAGDVKDIEKAIERARLLMTIEGEQTPVAAVTEVQELKKQITQLTEQVAVLTTAKNVPRSAAMASKRCFNCRGFGHLQRDCPTPRRPQANYRRTCWSCGQQGHIAADCQQRNDRGAALLGNRRPRQ